MVCLHFRNTAQRPSFGRLDDESRAGDFHVVSWLTSTLTRAMATARTRARSLAALVLVALCITCTEAFGPRPRPRLYSKVRLERATPSISFPTDRARKRERGAERSRVEPRRTESPSPLASDTRIAHRRPIIAAALTPAPGRGGARAPRARARRARGRGSAHGRAMARIPGPGLRGSRGRLGNARD